MKQIDGGLLCVVVCRLSAGHVGGHGQNMLLENVRLSRLCCCACTTAAAQPQVFSARVVLEQNQASTPHHKRSTCRMAFLRRLRSADTVNCRGTLLPLGCFLSTQPNSSRVGVGSPARLLMMACFGTPVSRQSAKVGAVQTERAAGWLSVEPGTTTIRDLIHL